MAILPQLVPSQPNKQNEGRFHQGDGKNFAHHPRGAPLVMTALATFVGAGVLGMPYTFSSSGWLLVLLALAALSVASTYAMHLSVKIRTRLQSQGRLDIPSACHYGEIGRIVAGTAGLFIVTIFTVASKVGFAFSYVIFLADGIGRIAQLHRGYVCFVCVPAVAGLLRGPVREVKSPSWGFSLTTPHLTYLWGLVSVLLQAVQTYTSYDIQQGHGPLLAILLSNVLYVTGASIYGIDGAAAVSSFDRHSSRADRERFPYLLTVGTGDVSVPLFPVQDAVKSVSSLWAGNRRSGVLFSSLQPPSPVLREPTKQLLHHSSRHRFVHSGIVVFAASFVAYALPDLGGFFSLVGLLCCTVLTFVVPCWFHLTTFGACTNAISRWETMLNMILIMIGLAFVAFGIYGSLQLLPSVEIVSP